MTTDDSDIVFRPLAKGDLSALHRWFNAPHARRWFRAKAERQDVFDEYLPMLSGEGPITAFVALYRGRAVGMMEWERMGDDPEFQRVYEVDDPDTANCDVVLGEPDVAHRGLGPAIIQAFLTRVVFADPRITACVIDPETDNAVAIRAYEKLGFEFLRALPDDGEGHSVYLMNLPRARLGEALRSPLGVHLRPARPGEIDTACDIDDDACTLYSDAGMEFDARAHPDFFAHEARAWEEAIEAGRLLFACAPDRSPVGFASLGIVDGAPHLQQLSVRRAWMRRGIGRALLTRAIRWSVRHGSLWLTTYDHLPWNGRFYAREGFAVVSDAACGNELRAVLGDERRALPEPSHRVAMRFVHRP